MEGERDLAAAAADYEALLRRSFGVASAVSFDAMMMGVGDDGHTASLFPGIGAVAIDDRLVAAIPEQPEQEAGGADHADGAGHPGGEARGRARPRGRTSARSSRAARAPGSEDEIPSRIFQRSEGEVVWLLDADAEPRPGPP